MKIEEEDDDVYMEGGAEPNTIEAAVLFATACHAGQKDKGGRPYILHPLRVMLAVAPDQIAMMAAVMHDVVEDCECTLDDLRTAGFSEEVIEIVDLLSRPTKDAPDRPTHRQYVGRICDSKNPRAVSIKLCDSRDNLDRVNELPEDQRGIAKRYQQAIDLLCDVKF
jgi:guanosine-3',5'-bis(diphosphate) 3'-pyrophosphohydrolase